MNATASLAVGDKVTIEPGNYPASVSTTQVFEITKVPRTAREFNYTAVPVGGGRGVRGPAYVFKPFDGTVPAPAALPYESPLDLGVVVRVKGVPKINPTDLYVVFGTARDLGNKLVKLGGDGNRYWRSIPTSKCEVVDVATITVGA